MPEKVAGVEGIGFTNGQEILLTKSVDGEYIESVLRLMEDGDLRRRLGGQAKQKLLDRYSSHAEIQKHDGTYRGIEGRAAV